MRMRDSVTSMRCVCGVEPGARSRSEERLRLIANEENGAELWRSYRTVASNWANFAMKRISKPGDIFPVFRELFSEQKEKA